MASIKLKGDTSGEVTISSPAVAGTTTLELPTTSSTLATENALGVRNLVINGDMRIAQRGTSTTGLQYNNDNNYPCCDRWKFQEFGSTSYTASFTGSQDTDVPSGQGFTNSLKLACTTADTTVESDTQLIWAHNFEGQMLQHLKFGTSNAESLTLSFWVKSNLTGTFAVNLYNADNIRHATHTYSISTADTWEKITLTFSGDTVDGFNNDNSFALAIRFLLAVGSNHTSGTSTSGDFIEYDATRIAPSMTNNLGGSTSNYWQITGVQLEIGSVTEFEHRPYDMELARCQRYYFAGDGVRMWNFTGGTIAVAIPHLFPVTMRSTPTVTDPNSSARSAITKNGFSAYKNSIGSGGSWQMTGITADAEL